jgi:ribonuclease HI
MKLIHNTANHLQILHCHTQIAPPTPSNIHVNPSKNWSTSNYPHTLPQCNTPTPPFPNYHTNLPLKFHPQFSYYTDGSFIKPKEIAPGVWRRERAGYGIYSPKGLNIAKRLYGHQNILRAEMMALHQTLTLINTQFPNEPAYIFTDSLNVLYLLNTQIKHPTLHNSHPDQVTLNSMVQLLQSRTQPTTISKVRAHVNIEGNENADKLAKEGLELEHRIAIHPYEHAYATPYYYQKDVWASMMDVPDKGPVRFLDKQILKYDRETNIALMAAQRPNTSKWTENVHIDKVLSNEFWTNPLITDKQKSCIIKFRTGTYMGNARKQLFFGPQHYPSIMCPICNSNEPDTWLHVLLTCKQQHIHSLRVKRHNKAAGEIRKLLISSAKTRCFTLMNAGTFNNNPPENTVPNWLLPCTPRCHCNARFRPDILCVKGLPYQSNPPTVIDPNLTIQFIEFTYCNDRFSSEATAAKNYKYKPLLDSIAARGWKIDPLIVITAGARATAHTPSMETLETNFTLPMASIKHTLTTINTIAIQYATSILLHKRRIENHQPLPHNLDPP